MIQPIFSERSASQSPHLRANPKGTVVLFGEVLADIFPDRAVLGGAPFNVARHLKAFGQNPILITRLGYDPLRNEILNVMSEHGMDTLGVQCGNSYPTGQVQVHQENGENRFDILPRQAYDYIHPAVVRMAALSANPPLIYFGTLAQRCEISRRALKTLVQSSDAAKFLDINLNPPWYDEKLLRQSLEYADVVRMNAEELSELATVFGLAGGDPQQHAKQLINRFRLEQITVTSGKAGAWQINRYGKFIEVGIRDSISNFINTIGAGDGFSAVCILGILQHWPMVKTLERANAFATAICEIREAIPDKADFYGPFTHEWAL